MVDTSVPKPFNARVQKFWNKVMRRCVSSQHFHEGSFEAGWICTIRLGRLQTEMDTVYNLHFLIKSFEQRSFNPLRYSQHIKKSFCFTNVLKLLKVLSSI